MIHISILFYVIHIAFSSDGKILPTQYLSNPDVNNGYIVVFPVTVPPIGTAVYFLQVSQDHPRVSKTTPPTKEVSGSMNINLNGIGN